MKLTRREALVTTAAVMVPALARAETPPDEGVGSVNDIVNVGWSTVAPEPREEIEFEDAIYMNEVVETDDESAIVITFADGSKLTLGENAKVVIDKYVYNPSGSDSAQVISLTKGAFRFLSGSIPKDKVKLQTPAVTIGIRGTELIFDVAEDGETEMSTVEGEADCTDGSGETLTVAPEESIVVGADRRFRGRVRKFRHKTRSIAIAEGLAGARKRWRIRKVRQRRRVIRRHKRRN